jgi:hypothetical protein
VNDVLNPAAEALLEAQNSSSFPLSSLLDVLGWTFEIELPHDEVNPFNAAARVIRGFQGGCRLAFGPDAGLCEAASGQGFSAAIGLGVEILLTSHC